MLYLGCVTVVTTVSRETSSAFVNSLFHGIDVSTLVRMDMPWGEICLGLVEYFTLGWLTGATIASFYNLGLARAEVISAEVSAIEAQE